MRRLALLASGLCLMTISGPSALAQLAAPTGGVLSRTVMVESQYGRASAFSLDVDQREYWVTAKHVLAGAMHPPYGLVSAGSVSLKILNPGAPGEQWLPEKFKVLDTGNNIDVVVLVPPSPLLDNPPPSVPASSGGVTLGGDCEFLGFPYGGGWQASFAGGSSMWLPFVKHCSVSALAGPQDGIWVLDGINNEGFSGGPVVFGTGSDQKIFAVVSGYHIEPAEIIASAQGRQPLSNPTEAARSHVNVNSGFLIAYDIRYAINAIKSNPVGPLRHSK